MQITETSFNKLILIHPNVYSDNRGNFFESYNHKKLQDILSVEFVQDNESYSKYGVVRGLHYQFGSMAQAKLVRVSWGRVLDVVVDLRTNEPTYGKAFSIILDHETKNQMFIPRGFAHGFSVLSPEAIFTYKCDNYYSKDHEGGIHYHDPVLDIDWQIPPDQLVVSTKDKQLPFWGHHTPILSK